MNSKQATATATWNEIISKVDSNQNLTATEEYILEDIIQTGNNSIDNAQSVNFTVAMINA